MNLVKNRALKKFVKAKINSGRYANEAEVIEDALTRWKTDEEIDPALLKRLVAEGQAQADKGQLLEAQDVFGEIRTLSAARRGKRN